VYFGSAELGTEATGCTTIGRCGGAIPLGGVPSVDNTIGLIIVATDAPELETLTELPVPVVDLLFEAAVLPPVDGRLEVATTVAMAEVVTT
jgi:hypothetical protein